jgi:hypothetical protein
VWTRLHTSRQSGDAPTCVDRGGVNLAKRVPPTVTESETAASECPDCSHAVKEHVLIQTGDNNVLICQATDCDCVEIRSSASAAGGQQTEPND